MKKILLLMPLLCLLTGCYNYREINDLAIISGVSVFKEGNEFKITVEVVNPKKEQDTSSGKEPDFIIYTATGSSMQEAFRTVVKESPKKLYGAQIDLLIIDEETAKEELSHILDFFTRDPEIRSEFYVLIGKNEDILEITTPLENLSSKNIVSSLEANNTYLGVANLVTFHDLINTYLNPNIDIALPSIETIGNEQKGETTKNIETTTSDAISLLSNIAVFKDEKLVGYLTERESIGYNLIMGNAKTTIVKTDYNNDQFIVNEILNSNTKMEVDVKTKEIKISIKGTAAISEANYEGNLEKAETIKKVQKDFNLEIENIIQDCIKNTIQKYNSDIFGFRDLFYKKDPKEYKKLKENWFKETFPNLEIKVKSDIEIIEKGNLNGGVWHE